jgi:hypothetical protein
VTIPAGPFTLALNQQVRIDAPDVHVQGIILENHSPFACAVETIGLQKWLPPFNEDFFEITGADSAIIIPKFSLTAGTANTLLASWLQPGDAIPTGLPQTLVADAVAAAVQGLITTTSSLRDLGSINLPNGTSQSNFNIGGIQPTDRYIILYNTGGTGIFCTKSTGLQSNVVTPINDVSSFIRPAHIPLTGLDTSINVIFFSLPTVSNNPVVRAFGSSAPVPVKDLVGIASVDQNTAGHSFFTWFFNGTIGAPTAIRLRSATMLLHNPSAATNLDLRLAGVSPIIASLTALTGADVEETRTFGNLLICNGSVLATAGDPSVLQLGLTNAATLGRCQIDYDLLATQ